jgi:hypothetical protein
MTGPALAQRVRASVRDVVHRQAGLGIDIVDDGEHSKVELRHVCARALQRG